MNIECSRCMETLYVLTEGWIINILMLKEAIASNAIEHDITYEEMEERIFKHDTHTE